jgi:hypothetical protein
MGKSLSPRKPALLLGGVGVDDIGKIGTEVRRISALLYGSRAGTGRTCTRR